VAKLPCGGKKKHEATIVANPRLHAHFRQNVPRYFVLGTLLIAARLTYPLTKLLFIAGRVTHSLTKTLFIGGRLTYSLTKTMLIAARLTYSWTKALLI